MTVTAPTNNPAHETQFHPAADSAKFPGTDIFNALLGTIAPAPSTDRAGGIGRKGAPAAQQKRSPGDPLASINPTDVAVNQMATRSPAKATVAAAEQDGTMPRNEVPQGSRKPVQGPPTPAHNGASSRPDAAPSGQAKSPASPSAAMQAQATNVAAASQAGAPAAGTANVVSARTITNASFAASPLARLISPTAAHGADRGQAMPRAILRPVVAQPAQGRPSTKSATQSQTPARPQDPETEFASQLNRGFGAILRQNGGSLTLRLQPQDLGDMTIRMDLTPGKVTAAFEVESDQARQLLNENLSTLRSALEARGLGVDSLTVHVSDRSPQDALTRAEPETSNGGANPDGGARGGWAGGGGESGTDRPHAFAESLDARSAPESFPEAGATGVVTGGAQLIRLALDAVA